MTGGASREGRVLSKKEEPEGEAKTMLEEEQEADDWSSESGEVPLAD